MPYSVINVPSRESIAQVLNQNISYNLLPSFEWGDIFGRGSGVHDWLIPCCLICKAFKTKMSVIQPAKFPHFLSSNFHPSQSRRPILLPVAMDQIRSSCILFIHVMEGLKYKMPTCWESLGIHSFESAAGHMWQTWAVLLAYAQVCYTSTSRTLKLI